MLQITKMKIDELVPYEFNAKLHPKEQIEQIKKSILEFGNNDPIAVGKDNVIIEGHGRFLALKELGYKEVEVIRLDHLTEDQRKAYTLIHNKLTMNTDFDMELLQLELENINGIDMGAYDFELKQEELTEPEVYEDNFDTEIPEEPKTKRGQVYQLGNHRLMCGDSTSITDVDKLMNGQKADLLFTDPPYNVNVTNSQGMKIENDNMDNNSFKEFLNKAFNCASHALKPGSAFYVWYASCEVVNFQTQCEENDLMVKQNLIWVKNAFTLGRQDYKWKHEPCLYGWKEGAPHYFVEEYNHPTVIDEDLDLNTLKKDELKRILHEILDSKPPTTIIYEDKPLKNDLHPTMKPLKLCAGLIKNSAKKEHLVLDLFGGSGSTMMAC